jgi:hypothetical protein
MHLLFDAGLVTLTPDFSIRVSNRIINLDENLRSLHGTASKLNGTGGVMPSIAAIEFRARRVSRHACRLEKEIF